MMSVVAPAIVGGLFMGGRVTHSHFPEYMGKMSSARKTQRLLKDLKAAMGPAFLACKKACLGEYAPVSF